MLYDLGLVGLYAGLSKVLRPRKVGRAGRRTTGISAGSYFAAYQAPPLAVPRPERYRLQTPRQALLRPRPHDNVVAILETLERSIGRDNSHFLVRA